MEKSYRIHTNIINDTVLNVNMQQDYDFLEVLSLKLRTSDAYRLHSSNYGVIIGRVLANDAFGIPNARISVFIERDTNDPTYMETIYPYTEAISSDKNGRRYNLLPDDSDDECYRIVGTFPSKRLVLDDNVELEIYDKYWKFTTVTNNAGDYMIFGVPSGNQQVHVDIDLSDIGILSQTPRDFEYKGYNMTMFDSPVQFKESTNLDGLAQIFSQNKSVFVYPFWGDENLGNGIAAITRCDVQIQYKFEPTCVFMGAIMSDNEGNSINHKCAANEDNGMNYQLVTGEGTIEMIRKTQDGLVEEYSIQGNQLIDSNGVWCYQIPMNLDYIATDEYGNIIPTDNPNKGIPTRTRVRFRFSKYETGDEGHSRHTAKYLVPMNPTLIDSTPKTAENGAYIERMYTFGSTTPEDCFRDLYWNNVYSVKNYIPKTQVAHRAYASNYTGLKGSNLATDQNPIPFNKLRIDMPIVYVLLCIIFRIVILVVQIINIIISAINAVFSIFNRIHDISIFGFHPFWFIPKISYIGCISLGGGLSPDNTAYYPSCSSYGMDAASCPDDMENCKKSASPSKLTDLVQQKLAEDFKIVKLDFYQDWLNGSLYMPLWYWRKRRKKKFLFWTISGAKNDYCDCNKTYSRLKTYVTCNIKYTNRQLGVSDGTLPEGEDNWHRSKNRSDVVWFQYGLIKGVENKDGLTAYYYTAIQPTENSVMPMENRSQFNAIRLFATDIILLGNLNEDNLYGLPQFFKALPSTTANIPPIASVEEAPDNSLGTTNSMNVLADVGETGPSLVTGMDWIDGEGTPLYSEGLFMLLSCTYAHTKAKSCINVERLSELGMNLDMRYDTTYPTSSGPRVGTFEPDGLITKYELDDTENRAMFATMNHLGFVPQTYQDLKKYDIESQGIKKKLVFNETQVLDKNTNYYVPKFKFLYPTDLDGRMEPLVERYNNGFKQVMSDDIDEAYINFRLGDVQPINAKTGEPDKKGGQFYNGTSMPLYNNSFYFYFGIKKGNTAIEKFNKMFFAQCFKNSKKPFSLDISTRPKSYCPNIYKDDNWDSYIKVSSDDIQTPYSYQVIDEDGNIVSAVTEIKDNNFEVVGLNNSGYTITVTDVNGRHISEEVNLELDTISISYETRGLGTKYYDGTEEGVDETPYSAICNDYGYCGQVVFDKIYIDGYEFGIGSGTSFALSNVSGDSNSAIVNVYAKILPQNNDIFSGCPSYNSEEGFYAADLKFSLNPSGNTSACTCNEDGNGYGYFEGTTMVYDDSGQSEEIYVFGFNIYKPNDFLIELTQVCNSAETTSNTSTFSANIENGKNFYAYLNTMPVKFMIDNTNKFYPPNNNYISSWLNVHDENSYLFPKYNQPTLWKDFITMTDDMTTGYNKRNIIKYKFSRIFNLSNAVYVRNDYGNKFRYTADGGIQPLLYRSFAPHYADDENATKRFKYSDDNYVTANPFYPNIVGDNYIDGHTGTTNVPRLNGLYRGNNRECLGNYFMVTSNNGGYINNYSGDCSAYSVHIPDNAVLNITDNWKTLGTDTKLNTIPEIIYSGGTDAVCSSAVNPDFRAMFVDRRIDFDMAVTGPLLNIPDDMSYEFMGGPGSWQESGKTVSESIRVFGTVYNGIEMAYDDEYNVISSYVSIPRTMNEDGEIVELAAQENAAPNSTLEYTYQYGNGYYPSGTNPTISLNRRIDGEKLYWKDYGDEINAIIKRNIPTISDVNQNCLCCPVNYYDPSSLANQPLLKTFYTARINAYDIRQLFWSNNNKKYLCWIADNEQINNWSSGTTSDLLPFYLRNHSGMTLEYNGEFSSTNYPTKRYLDIDKIKPVSSLEIELNSCNYDIGLEMDDETRLIKGIMNEGEGFNTTITFGNLVPSPKGNNEDYGHFTCEIWMPNSNVTPSNTITFSSNEDVELRYIDLGVNYLQNDYVDMISCVRPVVLMRFEDVYWLKRQETLEDMERYWKYDENRNIERPKLRWATVNNEGEVMAKGKLYDRGQVLEQYPFSINNYDHDYIYYGDERLTSDNDLLESCRVCCTLSNAVRNTYEDKLTVIQEEHEISLEDMGLSQSNKYIIACAMRDLVSPVKDNLTRTIKVFEFSDFYDCRGFKINYNFEAKEREYAYFKKFKFNITIHYGNISDISNTYNCAFEKLENVEVNSYEGMPYSLGALSSKWDHSINHFLTSDQYSFSKDTGNKTITIKSNDWIDTTYYEDDDENKTKHYYYFGHMIFYLTLENGAIYRIIFFQPGHGWA